MSKVRASIHRKVWRLQMGRGFQASVNSTLVWKNEKKRDRVGVIAGKILTIKRTCFCLFP
jgi:hypothetical protein